MGHEAGAEYMGRVEVICGKHMLLRRSSVARQVDGYRYGSLTLSLHPDGRTKANFLVATDKGREVAADLGRGGGYVADCQGDRLASDIRRNRGPCEMCGSVRSTKQRASRSPTPEDLSTVSCRTCTSKRGSIGELHRNEVRAGAPQLLFISGAACEAPPPKSAWICLRRA